MESHQPVAPKELLEVAINQIIEQHPEWFHDPITYVVVHRTLEATWCIQVYRPEKRFEQERIHKDHPAHARYWWWLVYRDDNKLSLQLTLDGIMVDPVHVNVCKLGQATIGEELSSLQFLDL